MSLYFLFVYSNIRKDKKLIRRIMYYIKVDMMWYSSKLYQSYKEATLECNKLRKNGYTPKILKK